MDNKNFNADQSIELIQRMIRDTRRNLSSGSSNLFILWGYLLAATAVGIFLLLTFTESRAWQWLWLPALAAGWAATWWYNRRRVSQVKSYTDRLLEQVWGCIAGLAAFSTFVICMEREWPVDPLFPVLLLISAGLFISGTVIHNKYMYYVSCFLLPVAFGIIRESWINVNPGRQPDSVRRGGPRRARRFGIRTQTTSQTRRRRSFGKPITPWKTVNSKPPKAWR